jgi:hypothetical protein
VRTVPVTAVVPIKDQLQHTKALDACLAQQTIQPRITWLNDGSDGETIDWLEVHAGGVGRGHYEDTEGLTIYEAWNLGFWLAKRAAMGNPFHVLVVNNDVLLPDWAVEVMSQALLADETRGAAYPDWRAPQILDEPPIDALRGSDPAVRETHGVWGSDGMLGYCFMLAGHRIPWRPLVQDLAYQWWFGDNALAESLAFAGLKQVKVLGLPIQHAHEGTAHAFDLDAAKERDAKLWATRRRLEQVDRLNRGARSAGRRDWRQQRPPARPPRGA